MKTAFDKKLRSVRARCNGNLLLERLGGSLLLAGMAAVLAVLMRNLLGLDFVTPVTAGGLASAAVVGGLAWWALRPQTRFAAALAMDERLALKERFTTALAMSASGDPFAQAACNEARRHAERLDVARHFPVRPTRRWLFGLGAWGLAGALLLWMPVVDALGYMKARDDQARKQQDLARAQAEVKASVEQVQAAVKPLADAQLLKELAALDEIKQAPPTEQTRRQAMQKMGDISDRIKEMQKQKDMQSASSFKEAMQQVRSFPKAQNPELNEALAKGDLARASEILKDTKNKIESGQMTAEDQKALAKQMEDLARQLDKMSQENRQLQDELQKAGLDKELAKLADGNESDPKKSQENLDKLREELKKAGLNDKQIDEMMQKARASKSAQQAAKKLSEAMAKAGIPMDSGQISPNDLGEAAQQLDDMEALDQQLQITEATLEELQNAQLVLGEGQDKEGTCLGPGICKGCGQCQGGGKPSPNATGGGSKAGVGTANRDAAKPDEAKNPVKTRVGNKPATKGQVIASRLIKGSQVKSESTKELGEAVKSTKESAARAVSENQIPKKYEGSIKKYIDEFEGQK